MSGHSKWSTIKHKKGAADAKRGKVFSKLIKEITVATRHGGPDPSGNPRLRKALTDARAANMPSDTVDRAIKRGSGEGEGASLDEVVYEGYAPGGVALLIEAVTDNRNRTVAEIRAILEKHNGKMAAAGAVSFLFEKKGLLTFAGADEDKLIEAALEAGAEDVRGAGGAFEVLCNPSDFEAVKADLEKAGFAASSAEVTMLPQNTVRVEGDAAAQVVKIVGLVEEHDDVQHVYANFDIDDVLLEQLST